MTATATLREDIMAQLNRRIHFRCPTDTIYTFIVVGVGGTGGHLVPQLARLVHSTGIPHSIVLIDGDTVEEKNISRQNFIPSDIGKNKAEVLAQRYARAFGLEITAIPQYFEDARMLSEIESKGHAHRIGACVILGCVDNNKTRSLIADYVNKTMQEVYWIDAGNEEHAGQVFFGLSKAAVRYHMPERPRHYLVTERYPEMLENDEARFNSELSCAERAVSAPQSMAANLMASTLMVTYLNTLLFPEDRSIAHQEITFNTRTQAFTSHPFELVG